MTRACAEHTYRQCTILGTLACATRLIIVEGMRERVGSPCSFPLRRARPACSRPFCKSLSSSTDTRLAIRADATVRVRKRQMAVWTSPIKGFRCLRAHGEGQWRQRDASDGGVRPRVSKSSANGRVTLIAGRRALASAGIRHPGGVGDIFRNHHGRHYTTCLYTSKTRYPRLTRGEESRHPVVPPLRQLPD